LRRTGGNVNRDLRRQKQFKNPDLLEKLIQENNLIEIGSNFEDDIYNPFRWSVESFYDSLAKDQAKLLEDEQKEQRKKEEQRLKERPHKKHPPLRRIEEDDRDAKRRRSH